MASCSSSLCSSNPNSISFSSNFIPPLLPAQSFKPINKNRKNPENISILISSPTYNSSRKIIRNPSLDRHAVKQNKIRFVQKLRTLLLSKPKHYMPLHILSKCRSYLSPPKGRSLLSMIHRYPSIFNLFTVPTPPSSVLFAKQPFQLCVGLAPAAVTLFTEELHLKSVISTTLAAKLQKLLMLSLHHRLLLSKLVHLAPDLGLPPNFRSRLCNDYPDRFKTVDTSYGRALELVSWDPELAVTMPSSGVGSPELIVDRPLKFKQLRLRKGFNVKRRHREFLIKFGELPDVSPYSTSVSELPLASIEAEKRACAVVREVLGMTLEKRTLVDHLTHFRKDFGLSNKVRGMLVRHPDLFYVSLKGQRDSVFLVEAYNDKGGLLEKDALLATRERLMDLVREGKRMRREKRKAYDMMDNDDDDNDDDDDDEDDVDECDGDENDSSDVFENLFEDWEDYCVEDDELSGLEGDGELWTFKASSITHGEGEESFEHW